jgi:hypothetical protein
VEYLAPRDTAEVAAETGVCTLEYAAASSALTLEQKVDKTRAANIRVVLNMTSPEIQKSILQLSTQSMRIPAGKVGRFPIREETALLLHRSRGLSQTDALEAG